VDVIVSGLELDLGQVDHLSVHPFFCFPLAHSLSPCSVFFGENSSVFMCPCMHAC
jgi:hypothetical protein